MNRSTKMQREKLFYAGIFAVLIPLTSYSQTDSLQNFFPLHLGDVWKYYYAEGLVDTVIGQTFSVRDTARFGGRLFFKYSDALGLSALYRAEGARVYRWIENKEVLWFNFAAAAGDTYRINLSGPWKPQAVIMSKNVLVRTRVGTFTNCYLFLFDDPRAVDDAIQYWFAPNFGIVQMVWPHYIRPVLHSATINGRHYPGPVLALKQPQSKNPKTFSIAAVYPNPLSPEQSVATIRYAIPPDISMTGVSVELKIYNLLGQVVRTMAVKHQTSGEYSMQWNGADEASHLVPAGIYLARLVAGGFVAERKIVVLR